MKRVELQRNQALIVIHAEGGIEFSRGQAMKQRIGRHGAIKTECMLRFNFAIAGPMILLFFKTDFAGFTGVWV